MNSISTAGIRRFAVERSPCGGEGVKRVAIGVERQFWFRLLPAGNRHAATDHVPVESLGAANRIVQSASIRSQEALHDRESFMVHFQ
jgi:hypothetical protein